MTPTLVEFEFELENHKGRVFTVDVEANITSGYPPIVSGGPDQWCPGAGPEVELLSVTKKDGEDITDKLNAADHTAIVRRILDDDAEKSAEAWRNREPQR